MLKVNWLKDFAGAWIFYSILPGLPWIRPRFERIARFAPLIGLIIGTFQSALWLMLNHLGWPTISSNISSIVLGIWISGGIHIDGLMDTADGIGAGEDKCLEAMQDSRVGSIGVQSLLLVILIQIASLIKLNFYAAIAFPIAACWGRFSPIWAIYRFKYLHKFGSSDFHKKHSKGLYEILPSLNLFIIAIITILLLPIEDGSQYLLICYIIAGIAPAILVPELIGKKLKGHSGDTYGASVVIVETLMITLLAVIL